MRLTADQHRDQAQLTGYARFCYLEAISWPEPIVYPNGDVHVLSPSGRVHRFRHDDGGAVLRPCSCPSVRPCWAWFWAYQTAVLARHPRRCAA